MQLITLDFNGSIIIDIRGEKVKLTLLHNRNSPDEYALGIDAPKKITVAREELIKKTKKLQANEKPKR